MATATVPGTPATRTGEAALAVPPVPSWPFWLLPHVHTEPSDRRTTGPGLGLLRQVASPGIVTDRPTDGWLGDALEGTLWRGL